MSDYIRKIRKQVGKHRGFNKWVTPGGMIEPGELPADAAKREAWEETGLIVEPVEILAVQGGPLFKVTYLHGDQVAYTSTWFRCEIRGGTLKRNDEEMSEIRFFSEEDL